MSVSISKVTVLGAGQIGVTIAVMLLEQGFGVRLADRDAKRLASIQIEGVTTTTFDYTDPSSIQSAIGDSEAVLNALPFHAAPTVAGIAAQLKRHYFDLTEDVAATRAIRALAERAESVLMPQCGLAPGFIGILGHSLAQKFESVRDLQLRVGALPRYPTNGLGYNLTWSTEGLINEYCNPCEVVRDGQRIEVPALEGLQNFTIDGVEYEAFNTSGGLGTLTETLEGRARNVDYKTIRYPGHRDVMLLLLEDLRLKERRPLLKEVFENALPVTQQDVVVVFATASGWKEGRLVQESYANRVYGATIRGQELTAIQVTTAAGILSAMDLVREGKLPSRGFVRQEQINFNDLIANRFGRVYAA